MSTALRVRGATTLAAWAAAFGIVMALLTLFGEALAALPLTIRALLVSGTLLVVMVNLVMPTVGAAVHRWVEPADGNR